MGDQGRRFRAGAAPPDPDAAGRSDDPVLPVGAADPHIVLFGDRYYIYATGAGKTEPGFAAWSSPDLREWRYEGMALRLADVVWATGRDGAPAIAERNGTYYLYFSADDRIGVAVADSPLGPFRDPLGEPLVPYKDDISVIDPMAFADDDGQAYLYWGAVPASWLEGRASRINRRLSVHRLGDDMVSLAGPEVPTVEVGSDGAHIEASFALRRGGTYYLMWSRGDWSASDDIDAYRVEYATDPSATGPWTRAPNNPILSTDRGVKAMGPGHHSVLRVPGADEYWVAYHKHKADRDRRVCIDRMQFGQDGTIEPVRPTREGPESRPVGLTLEVVGGGPFRAGDTVELSARPTASADSVAEVELYAGGTRLGAVAREPYRFVWEHVPAGFHRLRARAVSPSGAGTASADRDVDAH